MSGFEVIGLILALYPILETGFDAYKRLKHGGKEIDLVIKNIKLERVIYKDFVSGLLNSGLPDADIRGLLDTQSQDFKKWEDEGLQKKLSALFPAEKAELIYSILSEMKLGLETIQSELEEATKQQDKHMTTTTRFIRGLRRSDRRSGLADRVGKLRAQNKDLQRLFNSERLPVEIRSRRVPARNQVLWRRRHAKSVYAAIKNGYSCQCDSAHSLKLELPLLLDSMESSLGRPSANEKETSFGLVLSARSSDRGQELPNLLQVTRANSGPIASKETFDATIKNYALRITESKGEKHQPIEDLCASFKKIYDGEDSHALGLLSSEGVGKYELVVSSGSLATESLASFEEFFTNGSKRIARHQRVRLALHLSHAVLQLYSTPWIPEFWSWRDFSASHFEHPVQSDTCIYIAHDFYSNLRRTGNLERSDSNARLFTTCIGEPILTRLGIALVELVTGKRLAELRTEEEKGFPTPELCDYATACRILDERELYRAESEVYEEVVRACLKHQYRQNYELKSLSSAEPSFYEALEKVVVSPLQQMLSESWGQKMSQTYY